MAQPLRVSGGISSDERELGLDGPPADTEVSLGMHPRVGPSCCLWLYRALLWPYQSLMIG